MGKGNGLWRDFNSPGLITVSPRFSPSHTPGDKRVRLAPPFNRTCYPYDRFGGANRRRSIESLRSSV